MSFLDYPGGEDEYVEDAPLPDRVYARVDRFESPQEKGRAGSLLLDCVDADWFDQVGTEIHSLAEPRLAGEAGRRISVVELEVGPIESLPLRNWKELEGAWLELLLGFGGNEAQHYANLFLPPLPRSLQTLDGLPEATEEILREKTSLEFLDDADPGDIEAVLSLGGDADAAAVYDVGQGACNALLRGGAPALYFDFGGGALQNTKTFPEALRRFCMTQLPPVVLSHWDWDHWSSARRWPEAMARTWIVPRHDNSLGPVHTRFLGDLLAVGKVLVWPDGLPEMTVGRVTLARCTGSVGNRNDSGLAMTLGTPPGQEGGPMLFPGDAGYQHVPGADSTFTSVVVPHHGGQTRSTWVPSSDGLDTGRLVYSYGAGNSYLHPLTEVQRAHKPTWRQRLHTPLRGPEGLGHVHLCWDAGSRDAEPPCRGRDCDLTCRQR